MPTARDPRWILLAETGEYSSLSRYREPDADDVAAAEKGLLQAARSGWLAVMSHSVYEATTPELIMVRPLCNPNIFRGRRSSLSTAIEGWARRQRC
jgi:hypothetical protein